MGMHNATREELLARFHECVEEEQALRSRRSLLTFKLERVIRERDRLQRHLTPPRDAQTNAKGG